MKLRTTVFLLSMMSIAGAQNLPTQPKADIIFVHANIYTGVEAVSSFHAIQRAEAIAVRDGRVAAVGRSVDILKLKGSATEVIDLGGHFVMPGFNDAHLHLANAGFRRLTVELGGVKSLTEFRERIRDRVQAAGPGEWIIGGGWDQTMWPVQELPSRWDIDEVTTDHPVFLQRVDGHIAVANTRALQLASITVASKDPEGGKIDRDSTGQATGILRETARDAVTAVIPKPNHDRRRQAIETALQDLAQWGVTSAQDNSDAGDSHLSWDDFQILEEIERGGKLTARISEWMPFNDDLSTLQAHRAAHPQSDSMLHTGMLKGFMDGSLGSRTAALIEPYADNANNTGLPQYEQDKLNQMTKDRVDAGFQIGFHAIGDKGVQMALDAYATALGDGRPARPDRAKLGSRAESPGPPLPYRARPGHDSAAGGEVQAAQDHRLNATQSSAHRHELGRGPPRSQARGTLVRLGGLSEEGSHGCLRHRLSGRTSHPIPRPLRRGHPQERRRKEGILSRAETDHGASHRRLHYGFGIRRSSRKKKREP